MNIIIVGEKYTGKTTLQDEIANITSFEPIPSWTTRERRPNEIDGVDYHFIDRKKFTEMNNSNEFVEHVDNYGALYGITKKDFLNDRNHVIVVEMKGLKQILDLENAGDIFIVKLSCSCHTQMERMVNRLKLKWININLSLSKYNDMIMESSLLKADYISFKSLYLDSLIDMTIDTTNSNSNNITNLAIDVLKEIELQKGVIKNE